MHKHKEHIMFTAIITLVIGGIGLQVMRSDATALQVEKMAPVAVAPVAMAPVAPVAVAQAKTGR
jgi:hypothetical protein